MVGRRRWTEDAIVKAFQRNRDFPLMMCVVMCERGGWVDLSCVAGCGESVFMKGDLKWYGRHPGLSEIVVATTVTGNNPCTYVIVAVQPPSHMRPALSSIQRTCTTEGSILIA